MAGDKEKAGMLGRRMALLAPRGLAGCETIDDWFSSRKEPLPGKREAIGATSRGFNPDAAAPKVIVPPETRLASWTQAGGNPQHAMGHLAAGGTLTQAWSVSIGEGGGYRRKLLARPVVAAGVVFAQDSEATVSAFNLGTGARIWRTTTVDKDVESTNVGGGLCLEGGTLFAVNGVSELLALDPGTGAIRWRKDLSVPARSAPMVAEGRVYLTTIDSKLLALSATDGARIWSYQGTPAATTIMGGPAPAYGGGIVVAGFASGELVAVRADTGAVVWTDGLGLARGRSALVDFLAIRGEPIIANGQVFVAGMGGVTVAADLLTGRRVWERRIASATSPWTAGGWLFAISTDQEIGAINMEDSRVPWVLQLQRWEYPDRKKNVITWYGPVLAGGRLIVLGSNSEMLFLNPASGEVLGKQPLSDAPAPYPPVVADGTVLVVTDNGRLTAWR